MTEQYIIKGMINNHLVYFVKFKDTVMFGTDFKIRIMSKNLSNATLFNDINEVQDICYELGSKFKVYPVCPLCHKEYSSYPAVSRKDNKTRICPHCGIVEALKIFSANYYL